MCAVLRDFSLVLFCNPMDCSPLSVGFPRQEYWGGLLFPSPGDLPDPGIKAASLAPPALAGRFYTTVLPAKPILHKGVQIYLQVAQW